MPPVSRRFFLFAPPVAAVAAAVSLPHSGEGLEALDAPPLEGVLHASGAPVRGFRFAQLRGSVTVIHALASWRAECAEEVALWREIGRDPRFQLAGLFVRDRANDARAFIARTGNPYDALAFDAEGRAERQLGLREAPSTFVLNPRASIIYEVRGPLTRDRFQNAVLPIIEGATPISALLA